ncbi:aspartyl/asparaginyl beta-hydroxylase domain-containing protein [Sphingomonas sp.]|uniref:aspartyl/asparaginyl beta-hydroxylase domain-containing protein n=1 Tax=Sphingomonas sp. TaxID=28214 RepID=UPI00286DA1F5|nr:aspartyl/asparaginyl beta-hydroxylase domain-containing protein [Sphingomonas sp.]
MVDPALIATAERAAASGDLAAALTLLKQAAAAAPTDVQLQLKLAAISKAAGQPRVALAAVHQALAQSPLDFVALVLRASLLEALGDDGAGEAWSNALAQRPDGDLPAPLAAAVAKGEALRDAWLAARETRMEQGMAAAVARADPDQQWRIARFRSNVLRKTKSFHSQPTHFDYPGLVEREFHPRDSFPWLAELEAATDTIAEELAAVMAAERAELVPYIQYAAHEPLDQWRDLNQNRDWTAIHLWRNGQRVEANARHCPRTMALLEAFPQPAIPGAGPNAMFSLLAPNTAIPPHVGVNNARLVCHLPLIVPAGCWFRVGAETRDWRRGEAFVFDDTIEHEAMNPSGELRVVFIFDIWHPGLSPVEREAVAALIAAEAPAEGTAL